eukprot:14680836-Alexandrium_andersonii.AAC.1
MFPPHRFPSRRPSRLTPQMTSVDARLLPLPPSRRCCSEPSSGPAEHTSGCRFDCAFLAGCSGGESPLHAS